MNTDNQNNNDTNNGVSNSTNNTNLNSNMGSSLEGTNFPKEDINNQVLDSLFQEPSMQSDSLTSDNQNAIMNHGMQNEVLMQNEGQEQAQMTSDVQNTQVQNEVASAPQINPNVQNIQVQNDVQTVPQMNQNVQVNEGTTVANKKGVNKIVLIIAIVIALVVCGVVVLVSLPKKSNVARTSEYRGEPRTVYFYEETLMSSGETHYGVYDYDVTKEDDVSEFYNYKLIKTYNCKTSCPAKASHDNNTFAIYDDGKFYEYDMASDKMVERKIDSEHTYNGYKFKISGNYVVTIGKNYSEMGYNGIEYYEILDSDDNDIDNDNNSIDIVADLNSIKDGMYALNDKGTITIYHENKAIETFPSGGAYDGGFYKEDEFYVFSRIDEFDVYTKEKKIPTLAYDIEGQYSIKDGKAMFIDDNRLLVYDKSAKESIYKADSAYAVVERYAIVIKDNKLEIYDAVDDKVVHSFAIDSNLKFLGGVRPEIYYENKDGVHAIEVFLQDTSKEIDPETGRIYGKSFEYNFNTNEETVEEASTFVYNE